jgi:polar amino acid transport system permease protein
MSLVDVFAQFGPLFVSGFEMTLILAASGFVTGFLLGVPISLAETYGFKPARWLAVAYVELIRGTPMLVQLFILYYALPQVGINLDAFTAAALGLGINSAAYQAEYFRGAILSIPAGQMEAAISVGLKKRQAILGIILPQSLRLVIPAWTNEVVYLVQYSSVAYLVTVMELTAVAGYVGARTFQYVPIYAVVALIYLATTLAIVRVSRHFEGRFAIPGLATSAAGRSG